MNDNKHKGRIEETIHQLVADLLVRRVKDPRVENVSIIRVSVSRDYSVAKLYFNIIGGSDDLEQVEVGLKSARGYIRNSIKKKLRLRVIPELIFIYDSSLDKAMALEEIIVKMHEDEPGDEDDSAEEEDLEGDTDE
ncbi:MAG: 30S ribosome-binding factor RbfA [Candidatus Krumholzibacteriota bacterium]|nr:30S ribosome-binding factor RbfA [Candidatus Krumholzibacteriota bacterium]